jgi:ketosteroid isomerase-like protein
MKFSLLIVCFCLIGFMGSAQGIDSLVQAEKDFANWSVRYGTKEAFLKFIDSSGVIFQNGKPAHGVTYWNNKEKSISILEWAPRYAAISFSSDLGFTTGPWTFRKSTEDTISAKGFYSTVWHKDPKGHWKFLVDLGVNNNPCGTYASPDSLIGSQHDKYTDSGTIKSMLIAERKFIRQTSRANYKGWPRIEWYRRNLAFFGLLNRNGRMPSMYTDMIMGTINEMPNQVNYNIINYGISALGDMGYVYGSATVNGKKDNYLRIWIRETRMWKLLHEVLRY